MVDESGRTIMSMPVNGQTSIVIETSSLRSGMYIVRATGDAGEQEACKIIIR
ncbi:T9SS type A sorting domain-containing protein [uncultured Muribaculum sp.]|uniref:T9SS type A sorting domain-containing protein n=1 Tax=uncultured Muribaculum sp. TaxID=1918613 RepID=UPI00339D525D